MHLTGLTLTGTHVSLYVVFQNTCLQIFKDSGIEVQILSSTVFVHLLIRVKTPFWRIYELDFSDFAINKQFFCNSSFLNQKHSSQKVSISGVKVFAYVKKSRLNSNEWHARDIADMTTQYMNSKLITTISIITRTETMYSWFFTPGIWAKI